MKIFNKGSSRSAPHCSYCRQSDHRIADCPHAERDWESLKTGIIPLSSPTPVSWYKSPRYWSDWYGRAAAAVAKIEAARQRANKKRRATTTRPRSCGFCGDTGHTRRTCGHMASFLTKCDKANANWKREAYSYLVGTLGIYVGSAINAKEEQRYGGPTPVEQIGLITSVNYDELNVMTAFDGSYDSQDFTQPVEITAVFNGISKRIKFCRGLVKDTHILGRHSCQGWNQLIYSSKLTSTAEPLDESWATDNNGEWSWLAKKRSYAWLQEAGIVRHIENWASKTQ
jgi:hypothetical protein